jgi:excisionase family DNA binding protein
MSEQINPAVFNRKEAAQWLGVSENTLVKMMYQNAICFRRFGRRIFILKSELERFAAPEVADPQQTQRGNIRQIR